jgi:uncharacterized protein involved in response to NO
MTNFFDFSATLAQGGGPMAPRWAVITVSFLALLVIAIHILSLARTITHPSRKRIRIANGFLMMVGVVALAYAVGVASPDKPRQFTLAWTSVMSMMVLIVGMACLDALNNVRLNALERKAVRRELDLARLEVLGVTSSGPRNEPPPSPPPPSNTPA